MRTVIVALLLAAAAAPVAAQPEGWYAGAAFGRSKAEIDEESSAATLSSFGYSNTGFSSDETDNAFKLLVGYRFERHFSLEGAYLNLGEVSSKTTAIHNTFGNSRPVEFKVKWERGFGLSAVGTLPFANDRFAVFGKLGFYYAKTRASVNNPVPSSASGSNSGLMFGAGLGFEATKKIGLRAEYERFSKVGGDHTGGESDFDFMSLGLIVRF